ncbi:MAG: hypothetical protein LBN96_07070 [Desulfovibrio sp.]|nr:hypothetical protein [Desulfovibrio sp.]
MFEGFTQATREVNGVSIAFRAGGGPPLFARRAVTSARVPQSPEKGGGELPCVF